MHDTPAETPHDGEPRPWWRDRRGCTRAAVIAFATLALLGMLYPAVTNYLLGGDRRVLVVQLTPDADQDDREALKRACGDLPSVQVVEDRGNPDPRVQGRFPVRFSIAGATIREEAALEACVQDQPRVRGFVVTRAGT